jgi:hypothetical protein
MIRKPHDPQLLKITKDIELRWLSKGEVYPVTIVGDRYNGTYSGALWLAFQLNPDYIPEEIGASDPDEMAFWRDHNENEFPIGKGATPNAALADLIVKLKAYYENW